MPSTRANRLIAACVLLAAAPATQAADISSCVVDGVFFDDCADSGLVFPGPDPGAGGGDNGLLTTPPDLTAQGGFAFSPLGIRAGEPFSGSVVLINVGGLNFTNNLIRVDVYLSPLGNDGLQPQNLLGQIELYFPHLSSNYPDSSSVLVPFSGHLPASIEGGQYRLAVDIDATNVCVELNELNNKVAAGPTIAVDGDPDLLPEENSLEPVGNVPQGGTAYLAAKVRNDGRAPIPGPAAIAMRYRAVASGGDELGGTTLGTTTLFVADGFSFAPGQVRSLPPLATTVALPPATYQIALDVDFDAHYAESDETNNAALVGSLTVTAPGAALPDLTPTAGAVVLDDHPARPGTGFVGSVTLSNLGPVVGISPTVELRIVASADTVITLTDPVLEVKEQPIGVYAVDFPVTVPVAGGSETFRFKGYWPLQLPPGTWHVGVIVNPSRTVAESSSANNSRLLGTVEVVEGCSRYATEDDAFALFDEYFTSKELVILEAPGLRGEYCTGGGLRDDAAFFGVDEVDPPLDLCSFGLIYEKFIASTRFHLLSLMRHACVIDRADVEALQAAGQGALLTTQLEFSAWNLKEYLAYYKQMCDHAARVGVLRLKSRRYCSCSNPEYLNWAKFPYPGDCPYSAP